MVTDATQRSGTGTWATWTPEDDPGGLALVLDTIDKLADDPRPAGSTPYGSPDLRRLRVGEYRVLYVIDHDVIRILVTHLGRTA